MRCLSQGNAKEDLVLNTGQGENSTETEPWSHLPGFLEAGLLRNSRVFSLGQGSVGRFTPSRHGDWRHVGSTGTSRPGF